MPSLTSAFFPAIWLGLGGDVSRWDPLTDEALVSGSVGLGVDLTDGLWLQVRGGWTSERTERFPLASRSTREQAQMWDSFPVDPGRWGDGRIGVRLLRGSVQRPTGEPVELALAAFVGAGALEQREWSAYEAESEPSLAATTLAGASLRVRWPGGVAPELYLEAYDRAWIFVSAFQWTKLDLQHDLVVGIGARVAVSPSALRRPR